MNTFWQKKSSLYIRIGITTLWFILFILVLQRDVFISPIQVEETATLLRAEREEYQGIYFREQKIGYVINHYSPSEDDTIMIDQQAHMNLNVSDMIHKIELHLTATLSTGDTLKNFTFNFNSPFYKMSASGKAQGKRIDFTLTTGNNTIENSLVVDGPPMLPTARRGYLLRKDLEEGRKYRIPWFDPMTLTAKTSTIEYRGQERLLIHGRVHNLHRFIENYGGARINIWLNAEGDVMKEESPAGFVFLKEPKFRALKLDEPTDELLSTVAVKITGEMPDLIGRSTMRYRLQFPEDVDFDIDDGRQHYENQVLTIDRETLPNPGSSVLRHNCSAMADSLTASPYIQADAEQIIALGQEILTDSTDRLEQVRHLADWVFNNLQKRPVLGIPDALTTLESRMGDCNEHAALFAALARSAQIPTRIAVGVVYHKQAFYYHAWNEVCVAGDWLTVDTTTNQLPADLSHIKFIQGGLDEQVRIGALLGKLGIEPLPD